MYVREVGGEEREGRGSSRSWGLEAGTIFRFRWTIIFVALKLTLVAIKPKPRGLGEAACRSAVAATQQPFDNHANGRRCLSLMCCSVLVTFHLQNFVTKVS